MLHTENVAGRGETESFQNVGGGKGVYNVLTFQKSRGASAHLGGGHLPPLKETLNKIFLRKYLRM